MFHIQAARKFSLDRARSVFTDMEGGGQGVIYVRTQCISLSWMYFALLYVGFTLLRFYLDFSSSTARELFTGESTQCNTCTPVCYLLVYVRTYILRMCIDSIRTYVLLYRHIQ